MASFAFLSQGRLYLRSGQTVKEIKSRFGESIRDRALAMQERNAWKQQGSGARFMGVWAPQVGPNPADMPIDISGVTRGPRAGELIYSLETPEICGLISVEAPTAEEQRLWHSNATRVRDLSRHPTNPRLACSVYHDNGTASIGVMQADGRHLHLATEGDSLDLAPHWVPGQEAGVVFQSAGLGRNRDGVPVGIGPFHLQRLDLDSGELETVAEHHGFDLLTPQYDANGRLHFIRRPYRPNHWRPWWQTGLDVLLLPWRLLYAFFQFFNFFSMRYTGRPLSADSQGARKELDATRMVLWGNVIEAQKAMRKAGPEEAPALVPRSWELVRQEADGTETALASSVLSYALRADGSILHSNGSAIFLRQPDGKTETLTRHHYIEQVITMED